jgi:cytochrome c oxidase subunit 4
MHADTPSGSHPGAHHLVPLRVYLAVFTTLMVLTVATVAAAGFDFGPFNTVVALSIAVIKATLVVLFFMHVKYSDRLTKLVVVSAIGFLAILFGITLADYFSRAWEFVPRI